MRSIRLVHSLCFALALVGWVTLAAPAPSFAQIVVSVSFGPPALPVYEQPVIPGPGYIWTPGYWAWSPEDDDYFWVPGTWVLVPQPGFLWTPGYWGWEGEAFIWHVGYWGPHVGFYGGINYGYGYGGSGYEGGYWNRGNFYYNSSVNNVTNVTNITNVYNQTVVNNVTVTNVSYNGGQGGITAQPTAEQRAWANERHIQPTRAQVEQQQVASTNRELRASVNHGKPAIAATPRPGAFRGRGVVAARAAAPYNRPAPAVVNRTTGRGPNPGGGGNRPLVTAHPAPSRGGEQPLRSNERVVPPEGRNQAARPITQGAQPRGEMRPQAQPRNEQRMQAQPRGEMRPQAQPRNEQRMQAQPRGEMRPQAQPRNEQRPEAQPRGEMRPQAQPRNEQRPQAQPRGEARKAPEKEHKPPN